jgi:SAM-dependent methyltransferase
MRQVFAEADGIFNDLYYEERVRQWAPDRWRVFQTLVSKIKRMLRPDSIILDLGAGEGFFTKCCQENGLNAIALEGSMAAVEWSKKTLGIDIRLFNLKDLLPFADNSIDFIMYNNVYEHVPRYINENIFREAFRVLKENGFLLLTSPSRYDFVERKELEHISTPTPTSLYYFGKKFGFSATVLISHFNSTLFTPNYYDYCLNTTSRKKRIREFIKRHQRTIDLILAPFWAPLWYINSRFLHIEVLDFVSLHAEVLFRKTIKKTISI